jgi:hypothetical protein
MQINPTFAFVNGATQTDMDQFESAVNTVIAYYDSLFTNVGVTLNVVFAYGESYGTSNGQTLSFNPMSDASSPNFSLGQSRVAYDYLGYFSPGQLSSKHDTLQQSVYSTLPTNSPFNPYSMVLSTAQEKALSINPNSQVTWAGGYDGVIGIISNEELAAGGYTADWTKSAPTNNNQFYMIGAIEHELSEVMGRVSLDGTNAPDNGSCYTMLDLFRYLSPGVRQLTNGDPAYFSIDNGRTPFYYFNDPALASGDWGDWAPSGPNGIDAKETMRSSISNSQAL